MLGLEPSAARRGGSTELTLKDLIKIEGPDYKIVRKNEQKGVFDNLRFDNEMLSKPLYKDGRFVALPGTKALFRNINHGYQYKK